MARRADHLQPAPVDIVDDGLSESEIVASVDRWRSELKESPGVELAVTAAEELAAAHGAGDV